MEQIIRIGMDTSKHVFQLHGVNAAEAPVLRKKLRVTAQPTPPPQTVDKQHFLGEAILYYS